MAPNSLRNCKITTRVDIKKATFPFISNELSIGRCHPTFFSNSAAQHPIDNPPANLAYINRPFSFFKAHSPLEPFRSFETGNGPFQCAGRPPKIPGKMRKPGFFFSYVSS
jgi:hypothetical protein